MKARFYSIHENEKIMNIIEKVLGATSPETSVSMEEVIDKGISMGMTETYPRGGNDGHPWWPRTSVMMGIGSPEAVANNEEKYLHRRKMHKNGTHSKMYYWVDKTHEHEIVRKSSKATDKKGQSVQRTFTPSVIPVGVTNPVERFNIYEKVNPGTMALVQKVATGEITIISKMWINKNPEKFMELYGGETI